MMTRSGRDAKKIADDRLFVTVVYAICCMMILHYRGIVSICGFSKPGAVRAAGETADILKFR